MNAVCSSKSSAAWVFPVLLKYWKAASSFPPCRRCLSLSQLPEFCAWESHLQTGKQIIYTHPVLLFPRHRLPPCLETGSWTRWSSSLLQDSHSWDPEIYPCLVPTSLEWGATSLWATALFTYILTPYIHYSKASKALNHAVLSQYTFKFFLQFSCEAPASVFLIQN